MVSSRPAAVTAKSGSAALVKVMSYQPPFRAVRKLKLVAFPRLTVPVTVEPYASSIVSFVGAWPAARLTSKVISDAPVWRTLALSGEVGDAA